MTNLIICMPILTIFMSILTPLVAHLVNHPEIADNHMDHSNVYDDHPVNFTDFPDKDNDQTNVLSYHHDQPDDTGHPDDHFNHQHHMC